jgi:hypothetical protein
MAVFYMELWICQWKNIPLPSVRMVKRLFLTLPGRGGLTRFWLTHLPADVIPQGDDMAGNGANV